MNTIPALLLYGGEAGTKHRPAIESLLQKDIMGCHEKCATHQAYRTESEHLYSATLDKPTTAGQATACHVLPIFLECDRNEGERLSVALRRTLHQHLLKYNARAIITFARSEEVFRLVAALWPLDLPVITTLASARPLVPPWEQSGPDRKLRLDPHAFDRTIHLGPSQLHHARAIMSYVDAFSEFKHRITSLTLVPEHTEDPYCRGLEETLRVLNDGRYSLRTLDGNNKLTPKESCIIYMGYETGLSQLDSINACELLILSDGVRTVPEDQLERTLSKKVKACALCDDTLNQPDIVRRAFRMVCAAWDTRGQDAALGSEHSSRLPKSAGLYADLLAIFAQTQPGMLIQNQSEAVHVKVRTLWSTGQRHRSSQR